MRQHNITLGPYFSWRKLQRVPAHEISFLEWGQGHETVFCVHGLTRNAYDFNRLALGLSADFRVISIDMPGRGHSQWFDHHAYYNYHTYIKDVLLLFKKLSLGPVHWVGTSMGGIIGMALATYYPKLIKTLIINDVGPELPGKTLERIGKYVSMTPEFSNLDEAKQHLKMILKPFAIQDEEVWDEMAKYGVKLHASGKYRLNYDPAIANGMTNTKASGDVSLWYLWHKIKCRTLLIHGEKSDILLPSIIKKMQKIRSFDLYDVPHAGHAPALVSQAEINTIHSWLTSHANLN